MRTLTTVCCGPCFNDDANAENLSNTAIFVNTHKPRGRTVTYKRSSAPCSDDEIKQAFLAGKRIQVVWSRGKDGMEASAESGKDRGWMPFCARLCV